MKNKTKVFLTLFLGLIIFSLAVPTLAAEIPEIINAPFVGEIQTKNFSLPILTIIIAALDGFNPCAMWTLLFLITLLINMKNKKRMWTLGVVFIITSGLIYFLFMTAWLNFFLFIGLVFWVRIAIAIFAIGAGFYQLKKYRDNKDGTCKVATTKKRKTRFDKIKKIVYRKNIFYALAGIILLAGAVNLVELLCSAGLPAIYTSILTLTEVPTWQYYLYLALYIFIFLLDDLIIFFIAMFTLQTVGISTKYSRFSSLIGGLIMLAIGLLLILKPEWLMFG